jgi:type I restriction enzyme S subunit
MLTHRTSTILGDIPSEWDRELLYNLLKEQKGGNWGDNDGETAVNVLRSTNFTNHGTLDFSDVAIRFFKSSKAQTFGLKEKDLLLERSGGGPSQPVGRIGFVPNDLPEY